MAEKQMNKAGWNFNNSYATLPKSFYTIINPTPVSSPKLIILNQSLAKFLGLNVDELLNNNGVSIFAGNEMAPGSLPLAQAYAGHQYAYFTMLGDGRAVLLGEQITPSGERYDIQLKGSGQTPYSRRGDGRASLEPMLREFIISEAMYALGIPTTRSLAVVTTGEAIMRREEEIGAILTRVASSHIRVGTFQYVSKWGSYEDLKTLADYTIQRHYSNITNDNNRYLQLFKEVIKRQASLIAKWQLVGFVHGVMNTDNVTISGETIDYGPCAFMDRYDISTVFSSIDAHGRYAYGNQPSIDAWNLARFAEAILPLLHEDQSKAVELAQDALEEFSTFYQYLWLKGMRAKLGMFTEEDNDELLINTLLAIMQNNNADYTNTFLALTFNQLCDNDMFETVEFKDWFKLWKERLVVQQKTKDEVLQLMKKNNPAVIPRNHRVEEALKAATEGDLSVMDRLLYILSNPYAHSPEQEEFKEVPLETGVKYRTYCGT